MEVINQSGRQSVTVRLQRDELLAVNNALNEVLHGPEAIDREEFHPYGRRAGRGTGAARRRRRGLRATRT